MVNASEDLDRDHDFSDHEVMIINGMRVTQAACHNASRESGWWTDPKTGEKIDAKPLIPTKLCLIHSEISEGLEAARKGLMDDKLPHRDGLEVELADAIIRICDLAGALDLDLGGAVVEKMRYNAQRADHKLTNRAQAGGKAF